MGTPTKQTQTYGFLAMPDPNTYTPDWRVDVEPEQADDYDSTSDDDQASDDESE